MENVPVGLHHLNIGSPPKNGDSGKKIQRTGSPQPAPLDSTTRRASLRASRLARDLF